MFTRVNSNWVPIPRDVRANVLLRANYCCEDCGEKKRLEMHHLTYRRHIPHLHPWDDFAIFGHETPDDLVALCRECHHARHRDLNGEFWTDPEEMADHWWWYYEESERG